MYRLKQIPEDFSVTELMDLDTSCGGRYAYYLLWKRGWTTQRACQRVARAFGKRMKFMNFAGNKDKNAVTEQYISLLHGPPKDLDMGDIKVVYIGNGRERINMGCLNGNRFRIVARNLGEDECKNLNRLREKKIFRFPNYFDEQRFGKKGNNHIVGRLIICKKYREACALIPETGERLKEYPNDFVGALRMLPKRVLRIYPHAYQSWLWNRMARELIENGAKGDVPIIGYETKETVGVKNILRKEGITLDMFRQKAFPEFNLKGGKRELWARAESMRIGQEENDELNRGKKKVLMEFRLGPGCYATMAVKFMMGAE